MLWPAGGGIPGCCRLLEVKSPNDRLSSRQQVKCVRWKERLLFVSKDCVLAKCNSFFFMPWNSSSKWMVAVLFGVHVSSPYLLFCPLTFYFVPYRFGFIYCSVLVCMSAFAMSKHMVQRCPAHRWGEEMLTSLERVWKEKWQEQPLDLMESWKGSSCMIADGDHQRLCCSKVRNCIWLFRGSLLFLNLSYN